MQPRTSRAVGAGFRVAAQTGQGANLPGGTSLGFLVKGRTGLVASVAFGTVIKDLHGDAHLLWELGFWKVGLKVLVELGG